MNHLARRADHQGHACGQIASPVSHIKGPHARLKLVVEGTKAHGVLRWGRRGDSIQQLQ